MEKASIQAKIKDQVEDFIVEEIGDKWVCKVSDIFAPNLNPDLAGLDMNGSREFLWCEMEKQNIDHFQAIKEVALQIGKGVGAIGYGGTKDKKAWTSQRISIFQPDIEKIKAFHHPKITLKNFKWNKRKIKMGYLEANHFKITLRDIDKKDAIKISSSIRKTDWFPNYFGAQRFGSLRGNNVKIGKLIFKRKFKEAIWAILTDIGDEQPEVKFAREKLKQEKDFATAVEYFPNYLRLEKQILFYLAKNPDDFLGAIKRAERKNILMFLHAVQSKIFNDILGQALEEGMDFTKEGQKSCLLMGYKTRFFNGRLGEIEQQVLADHDLKLEDFDIQEIPYFRIKGSFRKAVTEVKDLEVEVADDEKFSSSKKIILKFILPSGVYATTFLENFVNLNL
ncbi:tRNA pseudouridine(13) synthase TruD [Candidatus Pacearchaeota archaeon]|nr:tRNA pseudouridine(13) synthase TruD [Candidatus Pacearchaeota archaeon]